VRDENATSSFVDRIARLLERVEYRRADTIESKQAIFRMRHEAYTREGYIEQQPSGLFTDPDDDSWNAWLIACYIDGELASSLRLHIASRPSQRLPVVSAFPDIVEPRLRGGDLVIDASRHTSRLEFTRAFPQLPYITMRAAFVAEDYFGADYITAALRTNYQAAFRRMYGAVEWAPPRHYAHLSRPQALMAYPCVEMWKATRDRYPFLQSTAAERQALFGRSSNCDANIYSELTGADPSTGRPRAAGFSVREAFAS
jgi:hypothetical protein